MSSGSIARLGFEPMALDLDIESREPKTSTRRLSRLSARSPSPALSAWSTGPAGPPVMAMSPSLSVRAANGRCASSPSLGSSHSAETRRIVMAEAGPVLRQENDRRARIVPFRRHAKGGGRVAEIDRRLRADNRLHAFLGELFGKFERAEEIIGVRDRQRRAWRSPWARPWPASRWSARLRAANRRCARADLPKLTALRTDGPCAPNPWTSLSQAGGPASSRSGQVLWMTSPFSLGRRGWDEGELRLLSPWERGRGEGDPWPLTRTRPGPRSLRGRRSRC